jgi:dienelactone hydrolase
MRTSLRFHRCAFIAALLILLAAITPVRAQAQAHDSRQPDAPLHEQVLQLPGDSNNPVTLEVTLYTPVGNPPFPLAVMNHGATDASATNRGERYRFTLSAYYFLSRGYAVALPMMRGFADSGGSISHLGCDLAADGIANARDIRAVIGDLANRPDIDTSRVVVAGQSFGGWNTLAFGTLAPANVRGLIDFSGGVRASYCRMLDDSLIAAAGYFGAHTTLPSIWFYGDNDKLFPVTTWRRMYARYTRAGARAELVAYGNFMTDSHQMLSYPEAMPIWVPKVDSFLQSIGLPSAVLHPEYLPTPFPPPTHFAPIDDAAALPVKDEQERDLYRQFLTRPFPRVFVVGANGGAAFGNGGEDPLGKLLRDCAAVRVVCWPYAVDDDVVWVKPAAVMLAHATEALVVRKTVPAGGTATIDISFSVNPDCTARMLPRMAMTQQPAHGLARIGQRLGFPNYPPASRLADCDNVQVEGTALDYTPARGFTGTDSLAFEVSVGTGLPRTYRVALTVQ